MYLLSFVNHQKSSTGDGVDALESRAAGNYSGTSLWDMSHRTGGSSDMPRLPVPPLVLTEVGPA